MDKKGQASPLLYSVLFEILNYVFFHISSFPPFLFKAESKRGLRQGWEPEKMRGLVGEDWPRIRCHPDSLMPWSYLHLAKRSCCSMEMEGGGKSLKRLCLPLCFQTEMETDINRGKENCSLSSVSTVYFFQKSSLTCFFFVCQLVVLMTYKDSFKWQKKFDIFVI